MNVSSVLNIGEVPAVPVNSTKKENRRLVSIRSKALPGASVGVLFIGKCSHCGALIQVRVSPIPKYRSEKGSVSSDNSVARLYPVMEKTFNLLHALEHPGCGWPVTVH